MAPGGRLPIVDHAPDGIYEINTKSNKATLFFGDSHAMQYSPRVVSLVGKNPKLNNIIFAVYSACPPIPNVFTGWNELGGVPSWADSKKCEDVKRYAFSLISNSQIDSVVIAASWNSYFLMNKSQPRAYESNYYAIDNSKRFQLNSDSGINAELANLENFLSSIPKQIHVILVLDNPIDIQFDPNNIIQRNITHELVKINSDQQWVYDQMIAIADRQHVEYISPHKWYCDSSYCNILSDDKPIYKDKGHFTASFVRKFAVDIDSSLTSR